VSDECVRELDWCKRKKQRLYLTLYRSGRGRRIDDRGGGRISIAMKPATSLEIKGRFEGGNRRVIKGEIAVGGASPCLEKLIERGGDARGTVVMAGDRHGITTCGNKGGDKAGGRGRN
jgi:hypothetical protein